MKIEFPSNASAAFAGAWLGAIGMPVPQWIKAHQSPEHQIRDLLLWGIPFFYVPVFYLVLGIGRDPNSAFLQSLLRMWYRFIAAAGTTTAAILLKKTF